MITPIPRPNAATTKRINASRFRVSVGLLAIFAAHCARGAIVQALDGAGGDVFGETVSVSGANSLVGAFQADINRGSVYLFRNLDTASGTVTQTAKLLASDGASLLAFGVRVSLSGNTGLIGSPANSLLRGSAYLFRNLDTATGTVTQTAKLLPSDATVGDFFGGAVSISGSSGLVGRDGAAYLFRGLDTATGTVTQSAKLLPSTGGTSFAQAGVSLSGNTGLVSAYADNDSKGAAFLYRNLGTATGTVTESARLITSDGSMGNAFGYGMSLSGNVALIGALNDDIGANANQGAAYLYRNLGIVNGTTVETAKLSASDGGANDCFGASCGLSGSTGLIGAFGNNANRGAAYLFLSLDAATGSVTESVKLVASDRTTNDFLGTGIGLDGNLFVIGANSADGATPASGKAYSGSVDSITTMDVGNQSRTISRISFISRIDWTIGQTTDGNQVRLGPGDTADVRGTGKAVFIGKNAGSDGNLLHISGTLTANEVYIGALAGNQGNMLQLDVTAAFQAIAFRLTPANLLKIEGDRSSIGSLLGYLGTTRLDVWNGALWQQVTSTNNTDLIATSFNSGFTEVRPVPEPSAAALLLVSALGTLGLQRRRRNARLG